MIPTHLKVLTIEEKPFVYVRELAEGEVRCLPDEIACPHFNTTERESAFLKFDINFSFFTKPINTSSYP